MPITRMVRRSSRVRKSSIGTVWLATAVISFPTASAADASRKGRPITVAKPRRAKDLIASG